MNTTFTAIDFETANYGRNSICQVGLVRVEAGVVVCELSLLVRPPNNFYREDFTDIHGITPEDTLNAPTFAEAWSQLEPFIVGQRLVAHNGSSFDFSVLRKTLAHYDLPEPTFEGICTYKIYRRNLAELCAEHGITLNHHEALSDARACATLYLRSLNLAPADNRLVP
jgi:DNA polymerase III subunit epsilon